MGFIRKTVWNVADSHPDSADTQAGRCVASATDRLRASVSHISRPLAYSAGFLLLFCASANAQQAFFKSYCIECHGPETAEGDVRLDQISSLKAETWHRVYEQLASGEMPPNDAKQPPKAKRATAQKLALKLAQENSSVTSTGLRRLNRREYTNTVRDLLGLEAGAFDPGQYIYEDEIDEGFDTRAESLVISSELLLEYLGAGEKSLRQALFSIPRTRPKSNTVNVNMRQMNGTGGRRYVNKGRRDIISRVGGGKVYANAFSISVPGRYRVTVTACGVDRDTYPIRLAPQSGPLIMSFGVGPIAGRSVDATNLLLKRVDLKDDVNQTFQFEAWIDEGYRPYVSFVNGSGKPITQIRSAVRRRKLPASAMKEDYKGPGIKVSQFKIEGPLHDEWPARSIRTTLDADTVPNITNKTERSKLLARFATRAFRRPVNQADIAPYEKHLDKQFAETGDWRESVIRTFASMMASPDFLYIREAPGRLDGTALANRLSYFFWSTMPDKELFQAANTDALNKSERSGSQLRKQVERMLNDSRSEQFLSSFADQWLALDELGTMPPDAKGPYRAYYRQNLESAMLEETRRYFRYVVEENRSVREFIDSDYSFLNGALAKHYGVPLRGKDTKSFRKVAFPKNAKRGGLLGHASILTLTSNGVETSPIERGVWVLAELMGTPPPPPPKAVPAITPDLTGAETVRDMLVKHRSDPACFKCHQRMDPLGFALEAYDPIGGLRTKYSKIQRVSTHGNYLGKKFADVSELKKILTADLRPFARNLIIRLAEYAKGRELIASDMPTVEALIDNASQNDYRFGDMILDLATSDLITNR